jgi:hypothetical protein
MGERFVVLAQPIDDPEDVEDDGEIPKSTSPMQHFLRQTRWRRQIARNWLKTQEIDDAKENEDKGEETAEADPEEDRISQTHESGRITARSWRNRHSYRRSEEHSFPHRTLVVI